MKTKAVVLCFFLAGMQSGVQAQLENFTFRLTQSNSSHTLWTTLPSVRVFKDAAVPESTGSRIRVYAAKNEFEPFQVVVKPAASGNVTISMGSFGAGITAELYHVKTVPVAAASDNLGRTGDYPDPLAPVANGASIAVTAGMNTALWVSVSVSRTAAAGDYPAAIVIGGISVPVSLHVFNFAVPDTLHVQSQMNLSFNPVLQHYSVPGTGVEYWRYVDSIKQFLIDRRLTPANPAWPGGLTAGGTGAEPFIDYDCNGTLSDAGGIWGFEQPADKYINGNGFNDGPGFPSFMAAGFQNNDASADQRPSTFCSLTRTAGDWLNNPSSPYNQKWFAYMTAMQGYLNGLGLLDRAYYYIANEPQDTADFNAIAWYSQEIKKAAPNIKLMVSEEPRPEIYSHPLYPGAKIDIWLPVLQNFNPMISAARETGGNEDTWVYFLRSTRPPFFNPITLDHPGIEAKFTGWFLWKYRIRGLAYYAMNDWSQNPWTTPMFDSHNGELFMLYPPSESNTPIAYGANQHRFVPSIRLEMLRDGLEDYEYLLLLNNGQRPAAGVSNPGDTQADKIIQGLTAYTRDDGFLYNLRRVIGLKLGGEISAIPDIRPQGTHPRTAGSPGDYYINFQDPAGQPTASPLVVGGKTYLKIGWGAYDAQLGYGWFGDLAHVMYQYFVSAPNELQKSVIYDDWGLLKTFEFDLPNGTYDVTASVGSAGGVYAHQKIIIEGVDFINDEGTTRTDPFLVRTRQVAIADNKLTMEMGVPGEYTMLNYLDIEAAGSASAVSPGRQSAGSVRVFPNPAQGRTVIEFNRDARGEYRVEILDVSGRTVLVREAVRTNRIQVGKRALPRGVYLLRVTDRVSRRVDCRKLVID